MSESLSPWYVMPQYIPSDVRGIPHWTGWFYNFNMGKQPCIPVNRDDAWEPFQTTWEFYHDRFWNAPEHLKIDGIGLHLGTERSVYQFVGLDLDHCVTGIYRDEVGLGAPTRVEIAGWAQRVIEHWDGYLEVSPSGTGLKGFGLAQKNPMYRDRTVVYIDGQKGEIELYGRGRFFTVTGWVVPGFRRPGMANIQRSVDAICHQWIPERRRYDLSDLGGEAPASEDEIRDRFLRSSGQNFLNRKLWESFPREESPSENDFLLMKRIAFWAGRHAQTVINLFLQSNRAYRGKAFRKDYLVRTAENACAEQINSFNWNSLRPPQTLQKPHLWEGSDGPSSDSPYGTIYETGPPDPSKKRGSVISLADHGYECSSDEFLCPRILLPLTEPKKQIETGCKAMKIRLQKKSDPKEIMIVIRPCRMLACPLCGPAKREFHREWFGTIALQWDQIHLAHRWSKRTMDGLWFSVPVQQITPAAGRKRTLRATFCDRPFTNSEELNIEDTVQTLDEVFTRWPVGTQVSCQELIRVPEIDYGESSGEWIKHHRQCLFRLAQEEQDILRIIKQTGHCGRLVDLMGAGHAIRYRVESDAEDKQICNACDDGWSENGDTYVW